MKVAIFTVLIITGQILAGCNNVKDPKWHIDDKSQKWYDTTRAAILKQSNLIADSTSIIFNDDSTFRTEYSCFRGHLFLTKRYNKGVCVYEVHYSSDGRFELRRELCGNGNCGFEGITYQEAFYGLSTWWFCDGRIGEQIMRFKNVSVGNRRVWNEEQKAYSVYSGSTDREHAVDSMPSINLQ